MFFRPWLGHHQQWPGRPSPLGHPPAKSANEWICHGRNDHQSYCWWKKSGDHHLKCIKPCKQWDKLPIKWCRISSINPMWKDVWLSRIMAKKILCELCVGEYISYFFHTAIHLPTGPGIGFLDAKTSPILFRQQSCKNSFGALSKVTQTTCLWFNFNFL